MLSPARSLVLVDWNGTVMSDLGRAVGAINAATAPFGVRALDRAEFQDSFTLPMRTWLLDLGIAHEHVGRVEADWNSGMQAPAPLRSGVRETLATLRGQGIVTGVVTAANEAALRYDLRHHHLDGAFDHVHTSVRDKAARLTELRALGERAFYLGDTAYDIESARAAGYVAVGVSEGYQRPDVLAAAGADHHIDGFGDLLEILDLAPVPAA
ncbi:HAD family hydrolase [Georgenia sp. SYP-B2076]|uniref:HAD family hydrolase n=1 Tax=Georgenia sp. SYP-B2076 TaxID=2495881 RepID=UPI0013DFA783|nr:HAD family hydrolase [Georgenia sp. SYP-B2076]